MKISIIFAIHNGLNYTKGSLNNLSKVVDYSNQCINFNIIIIDDGSSDGSQQWIKKNYPYVKILEGNGDLWWSKSMNLGLEYAFNKIKSDYVLCWNNDIIAENKYFNNLINEIKILKEREFLCSKILYKKAIDAKILIFSCGCYFNRDSGKVKIRGNKQYDSEKYKKEAFVDWCGGMGMLITEKLFRENGYFDGKLFPQYKGDADYCLRAQDNGFRLKYSPNLIIYNDSTNSGINNKEDSIILIIKLLFSKRSVYSLRLNYLFYSKYCGTKGFILGMVYTYGRYFKLLVNFLVIK